jgi:hypothetical protein
MKKVGFGLLIVGIVVLVLSLLLDVIGLGRSPGFGWVQIVGTLVGLIVAIVGGVLMSKKQGSQPR